MRIVVGVIPIHTVIVKALRLEGKPSGCIYSTLMPRVTSSSSSIDASYRTILIMSEHSAVGLFRRNGSSRHNMSQLSDSLVLEEAGYRCLYPNQDHDAVTAS
jgi:hypothetical protein